MQLPNCVFSMNSNKDPSHTLQRLSVGPFVHPSVRPSVRLSVCLSICPSVHLSIRVSIHLSIRLSVRLSVYLFVRLSICLSVYLFVCPSVLLSVRPSVRPFFRPSVRLSAQLAAAPCRRRSALQRWLRSLFFSLSLPALSERCFSLLSSASSSLLLGEMFPFPSIFTPAFCPMTSSHRPAVVADDTTKW